MVEKNNISGESTCCNNSTSSLEEKSPDDVLQQYLEGSVSDIQGDVNNDGNLDETDYTLLYVSVYEPEDYLASTVDEQTKERMDINGDGAVDAKDVYNLDNIFDQINFDSIQVNENLEGDFNSDGVIDRTDVSMLYLLHEANIGLIPDRSLSSDLYEAADINGDNLLNGDDFTEEETKFSDVNVTETETSEISEDVVDENSANSGDLNEDGYVDYSDVNMFHEDAYSYEKLSTVDNEEAFDINQDGNIDSKDGSDLLDAVRMEIFLSAIPGAPIEGDINDDGSVDDRDIQSYIPMKDLSMIGALPDDLVSFWDLNKDSVVDMKDLDFLRYDILNKEKPNIEDFKFTPSSPEDFFVSQTKGFTNINEDADSDNGNCAIVDLLMAARIFGKLGGGTQEADQQIEFLREIVGAEPSEYEGSLLESVAVGAGELGLNASVDTGDVNKVLEELDKGNKIILSVNPAKYGPSYASGHAVLAVGTEGDKIILYDSGYQQPITVGKEELNLAMTDGGNKMIIIGDGESVA